MAEIRIARTARKTHRCGITSAGCTRLIRPGDRYVITSLPPSSNVFGTTRWAQVRTCAGCVHALHGQTPDERAARPVVTTPTSPHRDEPRLDRPIVNVPLPAEEPAMTTDATAETTCTIVTEFLGIMLDPCGAAATHTSTGHCERGHTRTRQICSNHAFAFETQPDAVVCAQCAEEGHDAQMVLSITSTEETP